jgi:hypothetical protein
MVWYEDRSLDLYPKLQISGPLWAGRLSCNLARDLDFTQAAKVPFHGGYIPEEGQSTTDMEETL